MNPENLSRKKFIGFGAAFALVPLGEACGGEGSGGGGGATETPEPTPEETARATTAEEAAENAEEAAATETTSEIADAIASESEVPSASAAPSSASKAGSLSRIRRYAPIGDAPWLMKTARSRVRATGRSSTRRTEAPSSPGRPPRRLRRYPSRSGAARWCERECGSPPETSAGKKRSRATRVRSSKYLQARSG